MDYYNKIIKDIENFIDYLNNRNYTNIIFSKINSSQDIIELQLRAPLSNHYDYFIILDYYPIKKKLEIHYMSAEILKINNIDTKTFYNTFINRYFLHKILNLYKTAIKGYHIDYININKENLDISVEYRMYITKKVIL